MVKGKFRIENTAVIQCRQPDGLLAREAFFDIAKNANSLFIVATDYVKVEVHGTSFHVNVNAWK